MPTHGRLSSKSNLEQQCVFLMQATLQKVLTALNAKEIELLDIVVHLEKVGPCGESGRFHIPDTPLYGIYTNHLGWFEGSM